MKTIFILAVGTVALVYGFCALMAWGLDPREWSRGLQLGFGAWGLLLILFWTGVGMVAGLPLGDER